MQKRHFSDSFYFGKPALIQHVCWCVWTNFGSLYFWAFWRPFVIYNFKLILLWLDLFFTLALVINIFSRITRITRGGGGWGVYTQASSDTISRTWGRSRRLGPWLLWIGLSRRGILRNFNYSWVGWWWVGWTWVRWGWSWWYCLKWNRVHRWTEVYWMLPCCLRG